MHFRSAFPGFLLSENWPLLVQGDSMVPSISFYQSIPLLSQSENRVAGGAAAAIACHLDFCTQPSEFLGLRRRPLTPLCSLHPLFISIQNASEPIPSTIKTSSGVESEDGFLSCSGF